MKLKTLIENLKFYQNQGSEQVTLDIADLLKALSEVKDTDKIEPKKSVSMDVDGGYF